jgi:hypothetical protein
MCCFLSFYDLAMLDVLLIWPFVWQATEKESFGADDKAQDLASSGLFAASEKSPEMGYAVYVQSILFEIGFFASSVMLTFPLCWQK